MDKTVIQNLDGTVEIRDMTTEEKEAQDVFVQEVKDEKIAYEEMINNKQSGKQKLIDLGLTEDEIKALLNI